jgi:maleate isomerase
VSCTQLLTMDQIAPLEHELGVPVVTSNQATLWAGLRFVETTDAIPAGRLFGLEQPKRQPRALADR